MLYDLLPEYFATVRHTWVEVAWGAGVPAIVFIILWSLDRIPQWAILLFFVWALFVAGYHNWRGDHVRLKPRIKAQRTYQTPTPVFVQHVGVVAHRVFSQIVVTCLTEAPVYECEGHLQRVQKFTGRKWEETDLDKNLILQWANEKERKIEQHPRAEKMLNVFFVQDSPQWMIVPCLNPDADIPAVKLASIFMKSPVDTITAFRFYIHITCSARIDGKLVSIAPDHCILEARFGDDPLRPALTLM